MRSVRLDDTLEARLVEAASVRGKPVSEIIRKAIEEHCDEILGQRLSHRLGDVTGAIRSGGGRARRSGKAFTARLKDKSGSR